MQWNQESWETDAGIIKCESCSKRGFNLQQKRKKKIKTWRIFEKCDMKLLIYQQDLYSIECILCLVSLTNRAWSKQSQREKSHSNKEARKDSDNRWSQSIDASFIGDQ